MFRERKILLQSHMKHIYESIIGQKGLISPGLISPKSLLRDFDIVQTADGEFWIVVFDKKIKKKYADDSIPCRFILLGVGYIQDYLYNNNLEFSNEAGRGYDLDVVSIWRTDPEYVKRHIPDIFNRKNIHSVSARIELLKRISVGTTGREIWSYK